jgi:hypothetical protein
MGTSPGATIHSSQPIHCVALFFIVNIKNILANYQTLSRGLSVKVNSVAEPEPTEPYNFAAIRTETVIFL